MTNKPNIGSSNRSGQPLKIRHQPGELLGMYRRRANLSQSQLASLLGFKSDRMLQMWEGNYNLPTASKLKRLIEIYLEKSVFTIGSELAEANELWQTVKSFFDASRERRLDTYPIFDQSWFDEQLLGAGSHPSIPEPIKLVSKVAAPTVKHSSPHNLPATLNQLIGRESEILQVTNLLKNKRLVTLSGPGGMGKTRLALAVVSRLLNNFKHGTWWIDLATVTQVEEVATTIIRTLGLKEAVGQTSVDILKTFLSDKEILLVLDNFEQIIAAAPLVTTLLASAADLRILVTSRETLQVYSEQKFKVPPLTLPVVDKKQDIKELRQNPAIKLFYERAQLVKPDFELTEENIKAVAELCIFLEGLPLAIELAAAQSEYFTPSALLSHLQNNTEAVRLRRLVNGPRDVSLRQQTLHNTLEWSFQLLDEDEKRLFAELSVFVGGWTIEAANIVCQETCSSVMLKRLQKLVAKSLLSVNLDIGGVLRFGMLETLREYALEKLSSRNDITVDELRQRHSKYFTELAEEAAPQLVGPTQKDWLDKLELENSNIRVSIFFALNTPVHSRQYEIGLDQVLRVAKALFLFWEIRGYVKENLSWLEKVLSQLQSKQPSSIDSSLWAWTLFVTSHFYGLLSDFPRAIEFCNQSLSLFEGLGNAEGCVSCLNELGKIRYQQGDLQYALSLFEQSLKYKNAVSNLRIWGVILSNFGNIYDSMGHYDKAIKAYQESLEIFQNLKYQQGVSGSLNNLGVVKRHQGDLASAKDYYTQAYLIKRELGEKAGISISLVNLAFITHSLGDHAQAIQMLQESVQIREELGDQSGVANCLHNMASLILDTGDFESAKTYEQRSLLIRHKILDKAGIASCLQGLGNIAFAEAFASSNNPDLDLLIKVTYIYGAQDKLRLLTKTPLPESEQAEHLHKLHQLQTLQGQEAFDKAFEAGQVVSLDHAVEYSVEAI